MPPSNCLFVGDVPDQYRERYIHGGYRPPYSSFASSLTSVIRWNNETVNFWSHFIPFLGCVIHSLATFPSPLLPLTAIDPRHYPLLAVECSVCLYLLFSSVAHMFNCMSPRIRHVCFFFDYAAISVFGIGGACSVYYYQRPVDGGIFLFPLVSSPGVYMPLCSLGSCLACYLTCATRHSWESQKYVIRTAAFMGVYCIDHIPTGDRMLQCLLNGQECSSGLLFTFFTIFFYILSALFNAGRIPERWRPGMFDYIGHSHHWVHVMTTLGTFCHLKAISLDLVEREHLLALDTITFGSSLAWVLATMVTCVLIVVWFGTRLTPSGTLRSHDHHHSN